MRATILAIFLLMSAALAQQGPAENLCAVREQKQFDFWVGEWDLTWPGDKPGETAHGRNTIRRTLDGCVVEENFDGGTSMELRGMSFSTFDTRSGKWKQTWVDNQRGYLDFIGEFRNQQMVLSRVGAKPDGTTVLQRMIWKNIMPGEFDWSWESSSDGGKTWRVVWPIHYMRKS